MTGSSQVLHQLPVITLAIRTRPGGAVLYSWKRCGTPVSESSQNIAGKESGKEHFPE
jgi:hypothetical protein